MRTRVVEGANLLLLGRAHNDDRVVEELEREIVANRA
jgi:hypothetical protein